MTIARRWNPRRPPNLLLIAGCTLAVLAMAASLVFAVPHRDVGATPARPNGKPTRTLSRALSQSDYSAIYRAPIFTSGHATIAFAKFPPAEEAVVPPDLPFALMGTAVAQTRRTAIVVWKTGRTQQLDLGDTIADWTVEKIAATSLTLTRGDAITTLTLFPVTEASVSSAITEAK